MRKGLALLGATLVVVLLATSASADNRGVSFTGIGFIQNPVPSTASSVWAVSPDGTVFLASPASNGGYITKWTREGGWGELIGSISGWSRISADGTVMSSGIYPGSSPAYAWPGTWTGVVDVWTPITPDPGYLACGSSRMSFYDMGGNGDYAVGLTWTSGCKAQAFLWSKATNSSIGLGWFDSLPKRSTRANAVTNDGTKVAGWTTLSTGPRRGATWLNGVGSVLGDPNNEEPKQCIQSGHGCTSNSNSTTSGCPEFVDDGYCSNRGTCQNKGTCVSNVCVGGSNPGTACTSSSTCRGACVGGTNPGTSCSSDTTCAGSCTSPINPGVNCTSNSTCQDTLVCVNNPDWNDSLFKGEAYFMTKDGQYVTGRNFDYNLKWYSGYRANPDGTFTEIVPAETWPYIVDPYGGISADGKTIAGALGTVMDGKAPFVWREGVGTIDLQLFLIAQGLDELYFWYLVQANAMSDDGMTVAGYGYNPDNRMEGWIVDLHKIWVCHMPPGHPENQRTLGIDFTSAADHVAHGDFLGTCEFMNSGALSRATQTRQQLAKKFAGKPMPSPFELYDQQLKPVAGKKLVSKKGK